MQDPANETSKKIYPQQEVRKEAGVSDPTWWRWKKEMIIPVPDIVIKGRGYYSAQKREELFAALVNSNKEVCDEHKS